MAGTPRPFLAGAGPWVVVSAGPWVVVSAGPWVVDVAHVAAAVICHGSGGGRQGVAPQGRREGRGKVQSVSRVKIGTVVETLTQAIPGWLLTHLYGSRTLPRAYVPAR